MLQGARRLPVQECVLSRTMQPTGAHRSSFFSRHFSSYVHRTTALMGRWIYQQRRFAPLAGRAATAFIAVAGRYRVKPRVEARGRTHFAFSPTGTMVSSFLDPRFLRYKSPRNRQYLLRLPVAVWGASADERRTNIQKHCEALRECGASSTGLWARLSRRTLRRSCDTPNAPGLIGATLTRVRSETLIRRSPTYLATRRTLVRTRLVREAYNTFCSRRKSIQPF
jgi:hypothetical protein